MFPPGFTCPAVLWIQLADLSFYIRDYHSLWWTVPCPSVNPCQYRILSEPRENFFSRFGLFRVRSPLLAESRLISFPRPTQMFQFRRFPTYAYFIQRTLTELSQPGFPIRKSMDRWLLSPTHSLSQIAASFVGSWCQGIPLTLFVA